MRDLLQPVCTEFFSLSSDLDVALTRPAYLSDLINIAPLEAMSGSLDKLLELGPKIGLHFREKREVTTQRLG